MRRISIWLLALSLWAVLAAAPVRAGLFNPETFTLKNGLEVVVIPDHRAPVVTHMVWYKVGAADERPGKSGIAHFLEHLMFRGTANLADGEFSTLVARNGGRDNAFTAQDYTGYFQQVAVDKLDLVMGLEADRMVNLQITNEVIAPERKVIIEERAQRTDSRPANLLSEQMTALQFLAHPYRIPVIGWRHEVAALTRTDALAFYRRYYAPNNAILIVAGDVTGRQVRRLAEKHYGPIPRGSVPPRIRPQEPPQIAPRRIELADARVAQPSWYRSYLAPSRNYGEKQHAIPLRLAAEVLGGGATSRLYRKLVVEQGIATGVGAYYSGISLGPAAFYVSGQPKPGHDLAELEAAIEAVLAEMVADGITEEELERSRNGMLAAAVYARDSLSTATRIFGTALTAGLTVEEIESWPDRVAALTVADVNAALRHVIDPRQSVTGLLKPKPAS